MKAEKVRNTMETAHDAEMEMIDVKSEEAKVAAEKMHAAKMRAFDRVVAAFRMKRNEAATMASEVGETVSKAATDLTETVGMTATDLGSKAGEIKAKTTRRMQAQPWIAPMAAVVLLLALALSVGKKMRMPASA